MATFERQKPQTKAEELIVRLGNRLSLTADPDTSELNGVYLTLGGEDHWFGDPEFAALTKELLEEADRIEGTDKL